MHHPILTCAESLNLEHSLLAADPEKEWEAMNLVGQKLAHQILLDFNELRPFPRAPSILVLAGKGHNGGDALLAAHQLLKARPRGHITVLPVSPPEQLRPNTLRAFEALAQEYNCTILDSGTLPESHFDISLDGLLGMQFKPPYRTPLDRLIPYINSSSLIDFRVAIDLPSGLGDQREKEPLRANFTYSTGIAKKPLFMPDSLDYTGRIRYIDIGFFDETNLETYAKEQILLESAISPLRGLRNSNSDKRTYGHLFILAGSRSMPGALLMSVRAALKSGVGLVTAFAPESTAAQLAAAAPEAMWIPWPETPDGNLSLEGQYLMQKHAGKASALAIGPGLGEEQETQALLQVVLKKSSLPVVVDADALRSEVVGSIQGPAVLTPHVGEMARLIGSNSEDVTPESARSHAAALRSANGFENAILLKGPLTCITDGQRIDLSTFGGPVLSRGGSGDILTGLVGGLLAQGHNTFEAAKLGAVWHGQTADHLARNRGHIAVTATQLLNYLHEPLRP